jgi:hypothetical protein
MMEPSMTKSLPKPIAAYIAGSNAHNADDDALPFTADAIVRDEGRDHRGLDAIRAWKASTTKKYKPTVEILDVAQADGRTIVKGRVSGDFPGSPIELRYLFTLEGEKIARLEIAP